MSQLSDLDAYCWSVKDWWMYNHFVCRFMFSQMSVRLWRAISVSVRSLSISLDFVFLLNVSLEWWRDRNRLEVKRETAVSKRVTFFFVMKFLLFWPVSCFLSHSHSLLPRYKWTFFWHVQTHLCILFVSLHRKQWNHRQLPDSLFDPPYCNFFSETKA